METFLLELSDGLPESAEFAKLRDRWLGWILRPLRGRLANR